MTTAAPAGAVAPANGAPPPATPTNGESPSALSTPAPVEGQEAATTETPVEEPALSKAQKAAARAKEDAKRNREKVDAANRQAAQQEQMRRENERLSQENRQFQEWRQSLAQDPYKALKSLGMTEEDLARRTIQEGSYEQQLRAVHEQLAAERKARQDFEQRTFQEKADAVRAQSQKELVAAARDEKKYPNLVDVPDSVIINETYVQLQRIEHTIDPATGRPLGKEYLSKMTYDDICFVLDRLWDDHRSSKKTSAASKSKDGATEEKNPAATEKKPPTKTLTNKLSSQKSLLTQDISKITNDREQRKAIADQFRAKGLAK